MGLHGGMIDEAAQLLFLFEDLDCGMRGAIRRGHGLAQSGEIGMFLALQGGGAQRGSGCQHACDSGRQPQFHACLGKRLAKQMVIGGAAATDGGDCMELRLGVHPACRADRSK